METESVFVICMTLVVLAIIGSFFVYEYTYVDSDLEECMNTCNFGLDEDSSEERCMLKCIDAFASVKPCVVLLE